MVIAAGSVKLRRAQAMSGAAQTALLQDTERLFLAIRGEAEGQPEFRLALGETYARLGKVTFNLATPIETNGQLRFLSHHIDPSALRLRTHDINAVVDALLEGPDGQALRAEYVADPAVRRSADLLAQAEVLAPNNIRVLGARFGAEYRRRDRAAMQATVDRARGAKGLDTGELKALRERQRSPKEEVKRLAFLETTRARLEPIVTGAKALSTQTRAAGWFVLAYTLAEIGLHRPDPALLVRAREAAATAMRLWPAIDTNALIVSTLIDEAGVTADAKPWIAARQLRSAAPALAQLVADRAALADKIRASAQWAEVPRYARADRWQPQLAELRLARLLGDAELEARARQVFDDQLLRLSLEFGRVLDPGDEVIKDDLAVLDAR